MTSSIFPLTKSISVYIEFRRVVESSVSGLRNGKPLKVTMVTSTSVPGRSGWAVFLTLSVLNVALAFLAWPSCLVGTCLPSHKVQLNAAYVSYPSLAFVSSVWAPPSSVKL